MRLYAFLLLTTLAAARAATIPEKAALSEIDIIPEEKVELPENVASEQELLDQTNAINEVDNKLRIKPVAIPVEVVVDNAEQALKASNEAEEIVRPPVDLRNPGPPQRQEHETQNPEFYAAEQQIVQTYKQNVYDAQNVLRQGFQDVTNGIKNMLENNEQVKFIQQRIQDLRDGFIDQINKINGTVQHYLVVNNDEAATPTEQQTKSSFQTVEVGLNTLKRDFTRSVQTLSDGVEVFASLRADSESVKETVEENQSSGSTNSNSNSGSTETQSSAATTTPAPAPSNPILSPMASLTNAVQSGWQNVTQVFTNLFQLPNNQQGSTPAQSDAPVTQGPIPWLNFPNPFNNFLNPSQAQNDQQQPGGFGNGPFAQFASAIQNGISNIFQGNRGQTPQATQPAQAAQAASGSKPSEQAQPEKKPESKPEDAKPPKPAAQASQPAQADGPIRQILQNNPITQGIAGAIQRLQNNQPANPEKPREPEPEKEKADEKPVEADGKPKGHHPPGVGDNNDVSVSGVNEPVQKVVKDAPVEEIKKDETQKTEEVVDKTE